MLFNFFRSPNYAHKTRHKWVAIFSLQEENLFISGDFLWNLAFKTSFKKSLLNQRSMFWWSKMEYLQSISIIVACSRYFRRSLNNDNWYFQNMLKIILHMVFVNWKEIWIYNGEEIWSINIHSLKKYDAKWMKCVPFTFANLLILLLLDTNLFFGIFSAKYNRNGSCSFQFCHWRKYVFHE